MKLRICLILSLLLLCLLLPGSIFASETLYFVHQDHLGSSTLVTDSTGKLVSKQVYYPYGTTRNSSGSLPTERQYTGQVSDTDETGLYYYNARYYDPKIGKFTQADTTSDGTNRYAYVRNNPLRYTDPSGNIDWDMLGEDPSDIYPAGTKYLIDYLFRKLHLLPDFLSEPDNLSPDFEIPNQDYIPLKPPDDLELLQEPKAKAKEDNPDTNPYIVTPQSAVNIQFIPSGVKGNGISTISITVIPNPEIENLAIDPFMKIILPDGVSVVSFESNQSGWGKQYYNNKNNDIYLIDNYNISYGNNFTLTLQININRRAREGSIRIETWSDVYYRGGNHDQILQTIDKIPLSKKNN